MMTSPGPIHEVPAVLWRPLPLQVKALLDAAAADNAVAHAGPIHRMPAEEGWLVMFDLRKTVPWAEKLTTEEVEIEGKRIWVIGS